MANAKVAKSTGAFAYTVKAAFTTAAYAVGLPARKIQVTALYSSTTERDVRGSVTTHVPHATVRASHANESKYISKQLPIF